jgi:Acetoacetate decarboxylase (ADC)
MLGSFSWKGLHLGRSEACADPIDGGWIAGSNAQEVGAMRKADVLKLPSMPLAGPSYPAGPYRFINREFLVITYETDPELIRAGLPEPLEPIDQPLMHYEWIKMPDSSGFGS